MVIREPTVHDRPFEVNTRAEILPAIDDYRAGPRGIVLADQFALWSFA
jgi:hypothetical protein